MNSSNQRLNNNKYGKFHDELDGIRDQEYHHIKTISIACDEYMHNVKHNVISSNQIIHNKILSSASSTLETDAR